MKRNLATILFIAFAIVGSSNSFTTEILPTSAKLDSALIIQAEFLMDFDDPLNMSNAGQDQWVRLEFDRPLTDKKLIWLDQPWLDHCWIYSYDRYNILIDSSYCGYDLPISDRLLENQHHLAELKKGTYKVVLRLLSCESIYIKIRVEPLSQVVRSQSRLDCYFGIYTGLVFLSIVYGILMFFIFRNRPWLFYSAYIFCVFFGQLVSFGYDQLTIFKGSENAIEPASLIVPFVVFTTRKLLIELFDLELKERKIRWVLNLIALIALTSLMLRALDYYAFALLLSNLSAALMSLMIFILAVTKGRKKTNYEKQIIYAMMAFSVGAAIFNLKNLGILPTNVFTQYSMIVGSSLDTLILARALFKKVQWAEIQRKFEFTERLKLLSKATKDAEKIISLELKVRSNMYKAIMNALNPHFLFNALNSVFRCVQLEDAMTAQQYLTHLCAIMRIVLQNSEFETVPIEHEVNFLEEYMMLEKIRKKEMLKYNFKIDPSIDVKKTFIPTGIIQPILENAIIHGTGQYDDTSSNVSMLIERVGDDLLISVTDQGLGYHESVKAKKNKVSTHKSFAMKLIRRRLALDYDESRSNLQIVSAYKKGTTVTIKMPFPEPGNYSQFMADYY
ncbi:MAG: hypothetical protein ACI9RU_000112 [Litorivivens sp.]|jgi:hypothetical protein